MKRKNKFTLIELIVVIAILAIFGSLLFKTVNYFSRGSKANTVHITNVQAVQEHDDVAFKGWVKLTGNPKELTFQEWKELKNQGLLK